MSTEVTRVCPECGADGNQDQPHKATCFRGRGWNHAKKSEDTK